MSPDRGKPPLIALAGDTDRGVAVKVAYLLEIQNVPWAFADLDEIHKSPSDAKAVPLDASLIVPASHGGADQTDFVYRGSVAFP